MVKVSASTVQNALDELIRLFPAIGELIRGPDGTMRKTIGVYLNKEDVRFLEGAASMVSEGDEVMLLPPASGG